MKLLRLALPVLLLMACFGCASTGTEPLAPRPSEPSEPAESLEPSEPMILGSSSSGGQRYPRGETSGPAIKLTAPAPAPNYGYSAENPIRVGGVEAASLPKREQTYLNSLLGPQRQQLHYERRGSCCHFETPLTELGGLLDVYEVTYEGLEKPLVLYLNMYDAGPLYIPEGLTARPVD